SGPANRRSVPGGVAARSGNNQGVSSVFSVTSVVNYSYHRGHGGIHRGLENVIMPMRIGASMPSLEGATEWLSSSAQEVLKDTEGRTVLIHFWSLSCGMCKDN